MESLLHDCLSRACPTMDLELQTPDFEQFSLLSQSTTGITLSWVLH